MDTIDVMDLAVGLAELVPDHRVLVQAAQHLLVGDDEFF